MSDKRLFFSFLAEKRKEVLHLLQCKSSLQFQQNVTETDFVSTVKRKESTTNDFVNLSML